MYQADQSATINYESWDQLVRDMACEDVKGYLFRGQPRFDWPLETRLERGIESSGSVPGNWVELENRTILFFQERARVHLPSVPGDHDLLGWLALMQHYGAPTRLLDWTASPFVACYFAYDQDVPHGVDGTDPDAALWVLAGGSCRSWFGYKMIGGRDPTGTVPSSVYKEGKLIERTYPGAELDYPTEMNRLLRWAMETKSHWPLPICPPNPDRRMLAQQSVFTCEGSLGKIKQLVRSREGLGVQEDGDEIQLFVPLPPGGKLRIGPEIVLVKVRLKREWRKEALRTLAKMNITADALFPGLDGLGRATALHLQLGCPATARDLYER